MRIARVPFVMFFIISLIISGVYLQYDFKNTDGTKRKIEVQVDESEYLRDISNSDSQTSLKGGSMNANSEELYSQALQTLESTEDSDTKLDSSLRDWSDGKKVEGIQVENGQVAITGFTRSTDTISDGLLEITDSFKMENIGVTWFRGTISGEDLNYVNDEPSILQIKADLSLVKQGNLNDDDAITTSDPITLAGVSTDITGNQIVPTEIDIHNVKSVWNKGYNGEGIVINVQDSGIDFGCEALGDDAMYIDSNGNSASFDSSGNYLMLTQLVGGDANAPMGSIQKALATPLLANATGYINLNKTVFDQLPMQYFGSVYTPEYLMVSYPDTLYVGFDNAQYVFGISISSPAMELTFTPFLLKDKLADGSYETLHINWKAAYYMTAAYLDSSLYPSPWETAKEDAQTFLSTTPIDMTTSYYANDGSGNGRVLAADLFGADNTNFNDYTAWTSGDGINDISIGALGTTYDTNNFTKSSSEILVRGIDPNGMAVAMYYDREGHGTEIATEAAGRNVSLPQQDGSQINMTGIAPAAKLIGTQVTSLGDKFLNLLWVTGYEPNLNGEWIFIGDHIANISTNAWSKGTFINGGSASGYDWESLFVEMISLPGFISANHPGLISVVSSGNNGPGYGTVSSPIGISSIIVGAATSWDFLGYGNTGWDSGDIWGNDQGNGEIASFSSSGPNTINYPMVDVTAVGAYSGTGTAISLGWRGNVIGNKTGIDNYAFWGGTSEASAIASGVIALMLDHTPLTPDLAKVYLKASADDQGYDPYRQGSGLINAGAAISLLDGQGIAGYSSESYQRITERLTNAFQQAWGSGNDFNSTYPNFPDGLSLENVPTQSFAGLYGGILRDQTTLTLDLIDADSVIVTDGKFVPSSPMTIDNIIGPDASTKYHSLSLSEWYPGTADGYYDNFDYLQISVDFDTSAWSSNLNTKIRPDVHLINDLDGGGLTPDGNDRHMVTTSAQLGFTQNLFVSTSDLNLDTYLTIDNYHSYGTYAGFLNLNITVVGFTLEDDPAVTSGAVSTSTDITFNPSGLQPGFYTGYIILQDIDGNALIPYTYSIPLLPITNGETTTISSKGDFIDNCFFYANNTQENSIEGDWRFFDIQIDSFAKTMGIEYFWTYTNTRVEGYLLDKSGDIAGGTFNQGYPNAATGQIQRILVDVSSYAVNSTFTIALHAIDIDSRARPFDIFGLNVTVVDNDISQFIVPSPNITTSGLLSTYQGIPITDNIFEVNWTPAFSNAIPTFNSNNSIYDLSLDFGFEIHEDTVFLAADLTPYYPEYPEWSRTIYLEAGTDVNAILDWDKVDTDFDILLVPESLPFTWSNDLFQQSIGGNHPETFSGTISTSGNYVLGISYYTGDDADQHITFDFTARSHVLNQSKPLDGQPLTISLVNELARNGFYFYDTSLINGSGWNYPISYSGTFWYDNTGPSSEVLADPIDNQVKVDAYYLPAGVSGNIDIIRIQDLIEFDYNITLDGVLLTSANSVTGQQTISVDATTLWQNENDVHTFVVYAMDSSGFASNTTYIVYREDTTTPTFSDKPVSNQSLAIGSIVSFNWTIEDTALFGNYSIKVDSVLEQSGLWQNGVPIEFIWSILTLDNFTVAIEIFDPYGNAGTIHTISDTLSITVYHDVINPIINSPSDIGYEEGTSGNTINWTIGDTYPGVFNVTVDGSQYLSDSQWTNGTITVNFDGLINGVHTIVFYVYDGAGNSVNDTVLITVSDTTAPTISAPIDDAYIIGSIGNVIIWDIQDINPDIYNVTIDGSTLVDITSWTNGNTQVNVDGLSLGTHTVILYAYDLFGNVASDTVTIEVINVESVNPEVDNPVDGSYQLNATYLPIVWTVGDQYPDIYNVTLDGSLYIVDTRWSNGTIVVDIGSLSIGIHSFIIYVYDVSGNMISNTVNISIYDSIHPDISSPLDVSYQLGSNGNIINWIVGDQVPSVYNVTLDGAIYLSDTNWANGTITLDIDSLDLGTYTFVIWIYDTSGNVVSDTVIVNIYDKIPPIISNPSDINYELGTLGNNITWIVGDQAPGEYNITVDGILHISNTAWNNGTIEINFDNLSVGSHTLILQLVDSSGNLITDTVIIEVYDTIAPIITNAYDISYIFSSNNNNLTWFVGDMDPAVYNITVDSNLFTPDTAWNNGTIEINFDGLEVGLHTVIIRIYDNSSNWVSDSVLITVYELVPPEISHPIDLGYQYGSVGNLISWNVGDQYPDIYNVTLDGSLYISNTAWNNGTIFVNIDGLDLGIYQFTIYIFDTSGNSISDTVFVEVLDQLSPKIDKPFDKSYQFGTTGNTITWSVGDQFPGIYNVTLDGSLYVSSTPWSNGTITINIDGMSLGQYSFILYVYDTTGNIAFDVVNLEVFDNIAPSISHPSDITYGYGSSGNYITWVVGDQSPGVYNVTVAGTLFIPDTTWGNGSLHINVDGLGSGYSFCDISIYDSSGNVVTDTVVIYVAEYTPPDLDHPADITYGIGTLGNKIIWTAGDENPYTYQIYLDGTYLPPSEFWANGSIEFNIDGLSLGSHTVTITVTDVTINEVSDTVIVNVIDFTYPEISQPIDYSYEEGLASQIISWTIGDNDPGLYNITLDGSLLYPDNAWINGTIEINVGGLPLGSHIYTINVYDNYGNMASDTVIITVLDLTAPISTGIADITYHIATTGNLIQIGNVEDNHPGIYNVTKSGVLLISDTTWTNGSLEINIDGLTTGTYLYTIRIYDTSGNLLTLNCNVVVYDDTIPEVDNPADLIYELGSVNHKISWIVGDQDPGIYNVTLDGSLYQDDTVWSNGTIDLNVDGLSLGSYVVTFYLYDTTGNYISDSVTVQVIDTRVPELNSPVDITYQLGSITNSIIWTIGDHDPGIYNITLNGALYQSNSVWTNGTIELNVDGLSVGTYIVSIYVYDSSWNLISDNVQINVVDIIAPIIDNPEDITYHIGKVGNSIIWNIGDQDPGVYNVTLDGSLYQSSTIWNNGSIELPVDNLDARSHSFIIYLYDKSGNLASDEVIVVVFENTSPEINQPGDFNYSPGSENIIYWVVGDQYPDVYNITINGRLFSNTVPWVNGTIAVDVFGIPIGVNIITIFVYDTSGNFVSDSVTVTNNDYVEHLPFLIGSNSDFTNFGFPGSGTIEDPYRIEGYYIKGTGSETLISISGTDVYVDISNNLLISGGIAIQIDGGSNFKIENNEINFSSTGISLVGSSNCLVRDNMIINSSYQSIGIVNSSKNNTISNNLVRGNDNIAIVIAGGYSNNNSILYNNITDCRNGIGILGYAFGNYIFGNSITNSLFYGIRAINAGENTISSNYILLSSYDGINIADSNFLYIFNNTIINSYRVGINIVRSSNSTIVSNIIKDNTKGVTLDESHSNKLIKNIFEANIDGITIILSIDNKILSNKFTSNNLGIHLYNSANYTIISNNTLVKNTNYGLKIEGGAWNNTIITNDFIENNNFGTVQAYDLGEGNIFDLNYWSDANGLDIDFDGIYDEPYLINENMDKRPLVSPHDKPFVYNSKDISFQFGSTNNEIRWFAIDLYTDVYNITLDNSLYKSDTHWMNGSIILDVNSLEVGTYNFTIFLFNKVGNYIADSVLVTVFDGISPDIIPVLDVTYYESSDKKTVIWTVGDQLPDIYEIKLNGSVYISSTKWTNGTILLDINEFVVGKYLFNISIFDTSGNIAWDTVLISIISENPPIISHPVDQFIEIDSIGNSIVWSISDDDPSVYNITLEGNIYQSSAPWANGQISCSIDGLQIGSYVFTIFVYDQYGNIASDTVIITVEDTIAPDLNNPKDISFEEGSSGNTIVWELFDINSGTYAIYLDAVIYQSETSWTNGLISINIDDLEIGHHTLEIIVTDLYGNSISDTVSVLVYELIPPEITSPSDMTIELGSNDNQIVWNVGDENPYEYNITINSVLRVISSPWTNGTIVFNLDNLDLGVKTIVIHVTDTSGNFVEDTVIVTIIEHSDTQDSNTTGSETNRNNSKNKKSPVDLFGILMGLSAILTINREISKKKKKITK